MIFFEPGKWNIGPKQLLFNVLGRCDGLMGRGGELFNLRFGL